MTQYSVQARDGIFVKGWILKPFVPDNFKWNKIKHIPRINTLVVLKYKTNKNYLEWVVYFDDITKN